MHDCFYRRLALRADTLNEADRSVDAIIATENRVPAYNQVERETIDEILLMDGATLPEQVPLLDMHQRDTTDFVLGSVRGLHVDNLRHLAGRIYFADDLLSLRAWRLVRDGHLRSIAAGVAPLASYVVERGQSAEIAGRHFEAKHRRLFVRTAWQLREASLVILGADSDAAVRSIDSLFPQSLQQFLTQRMLDSGESAGQFCRRTAARARITEDELQDFMLGHTSPSSRQLSDLARAFDCAEAELRELAKLY